MYREIAGGVGEDPTGIVTVVEGRVTVLDLKASPLAVVTGMVRQFGEPAEQLEPVVEILERKRTVHFHTHRAVVTRVQYLAA